ncbi:MAG TPA: twin transmembrane helix small protein [Solimonas sp.]|nr:twin transmembrane helix small protein [Solimonas sp.]
MAAKIVIVVLLLAIVGTLMTSMLFLVRDPSSSRRTLTGLKVRVALSVTLILFVLLSYYMGWIHPHAAIPPAPATQR